MDVKLAIEATRLAFSQVMQTATLYGADGDFIPLVEALTDAGTIVNVASFSDPSQGRVAPALRAASDRYIQMNRIWLYEALRRENSTVRNMRHHFHDFQRTADLETMELDGRKFSIRSVQSSYMTSIEDSALGVYGSHDLEDLRMWLRLAPYQEREFHYTLHE